MEAGNATAAALDATVAVGPPSAEEAAELVARERAVLTEQVERLGRKVTKAEATLANAQAALAGAEAALAALEG